MEMNVWFMTLFSDIRMHFSSFSSYENVSLEYQEDLSRNLEIFSARCLFNRTVTPPSNVCESEDKTPRYINRQESPPV